MTEHALTLSLNPTDNQAYQPFCPRCRTSKGIRTTKTQATKLWLPRAVKAADNRRPDVLLARPVVAHVDFYAPRLWGFDVHGRGKLVYDVLSGRFYGDDRDIVRVVMTKHRDTANPRVEVRVASAQGALEAPQIDLAF